MSENEAKPETQTGEEKAEHVHVSVATQVTCHQHSAQLQAAGFVSDVNRALLACDQRLAGRLQDGKKLTFKVKWQAPLQKVFNAFCSRMELNQEEVVFLHNSERLRKEQTLEEVTLPWQFALDLVPLQ